MDERTEGYAPLRDYAAIGDGRTIALVAKDGSIDWLCLPHLDSSAVFAGLLDAKRGGAFSLAPTVPYDMHRHYLEGTNVLEATFSTDTGTARVTDAMTIPSAGWSADLCPERELVRCVEGVAGVVSFHWSVAPRFHNAQARTRIGRRDGVPMAWCRGDAFAVCSWDAGLPNVMNEEIFGTFSTAGSRALVVLSAAHGKPLVLPARSEVEARLETTIAWWKSWTITYDGPWREAVERSALALKLLVHAPSGAVAAAATTSLPEEIGGERNWDYRFSWVRDSAFILSALLQLGRSDEAEAFFWWVMHASQRTHPRLQVLYRLDGGSRATERPIDLAGYQQSRPVRVGNGAADQVQLDIYGDLLQAAWLFAGAGNPIDADIARRLAEIADLVCRIWTEPDAGLWEVRSGPQHFTQSKIMCWIALDRAIRLGERGALPSGHVGQWREQATKIQTFLEERCWSETKRSYVRFAGTEDLDASLLLGVLFGYVPLVEGRLEATVEAIRVELSHGLLVHRYAGEDGLAGQEGAFLACSFWLAEALARVGRHQEALDLMDGLVALANDVGLFAEEIDPTSGAFLGNLPQALTHLGLINAALAVQPNVSK